MAITTRSLLVGSTLTALAFSPGLSGCGQILGLNQYEIAQGDATGGSNDGSGGKASTGGMGGTSDVDDGTCPEGCDDENDCTEDTCLDEVCTHHAVDAGEECSGGVCNGVTGASKCVRCLDDRPGDKQDTGCSEGAPECRTTGEATCTGCDSHEDCDDHNDCTEDACTPAGECNQTALDAGDECSEGVCNGKPGTEACSTCFDDQSGTGRDTGCSMETPICDVSGEPNCAACLDNIAGNGQDLGCSENEPYCFEGICGVCAEDKPGTETDTGCTASDPVCSEGLCGECASDEHCSGGTVCNPVRCQAGSCVAVDASSQVTLIDATMGDGSFEIAGEQSLTYWRDTGPEYWTISDCSEGCAGTNGATYASNGILLAWFGFEHDTVMAIDRLLTLPAGTQSIRLLADTNFQTDEPANVANDVLVINLQNPAGNELLPLETYSNQDAQSTATVWSPNGIDEVYNVSSLAGQQVRLSFESTTNATNYTEFFIDNIRLTATVCE